MARQVIPETPIAKDRPIIQHTDGGYSWLHPTKGWRKIAGVRLVAQGRMAQLLYGRK